MGKVDVFGQPRMSRGHPCTLWDKEDINHFKAMLKTSKELQDQFAKLKAAMDKRMAQPLGVPVAQKDANGEWMFPGDTEAEGQEVLPLEPRKRRCNFRTGARSMP